MYASSACQIKKSQLFEQIGWLNDTKTNVYSNSPTDSFKISDSFRNGGSIYTLVIVSFTQPICSNSWNFQ